MWLRNFKDVSGTLARWLAILEAYSYTIEHRPGKDHGNADGLSRIPPEKLTRKCAREDCDDCSRLKSAPVLCIGEKEMEEEASAMEDPLEEGWLEPWSQDELKEWQRKDPAIGFIIEKIEAGNGRPAWADIQGLSPHVKHLWSISGK